MQFPNEVVRGRDLACKTTRDFRMVCAVPDKAVLHPESCPCSERLGTLARHGIGVRRLCQPSVLCTSVNTSQHKLAKANSWNRSTAFVTVLHVDDRHVRPQWAKLPAVQWRAQVRRVVELAVNLRAVSSSMPLHCLLSGRNQSVVNSTLMRLQRNLRLHASWNEPTVPAWASMMHQASFAKLSIINASFHLGLRLIYLDTDMLVLRNLDHLGSSLPPHALAFTFRADHELVNSGLMSVHIGSRRRLEAAWSLIRSALSRRPWQSCSGDGGDQQVWIHFLGRTTEQLLELPMSYNLYPSQVEQLRDTHWCVRAHVIHKTSKLKGKLGRGGAGSCLEFVQTWERKARREGCGGSCVGRTSLHTN